MNWAEYLQAVFALVFVLGLVGLFVLLLRKLGFGAPTPTIGHKNKRVRIQEVTALDGRRRLVLIRHDDREHLILLGADRETVIESRDAIPLPDAPLAPSETGRFASLLRQTTGSTHKREDKEPKEPAS